ACSPGELHVRAINPCPCVHRRAGGRPRAGNRFIKVTAPLQSVSHPDVCATAFVPCDRARRSPATGGEFSWMVPCKPQREALYLSSTGERYALGARNGLTIEGAWAASRTSATGGSWRTSMYCRNWARRTCLRFPRLAIGPA